ncbi:GSCFA domain-containing protein [Micromonospora sp. HM134]|uniref:GSCFA domain-containing protein n=1 Tax=Micromonospora sp. HM134 TaxID=2583243 RepID=UPI0011988FD9|nr:GSCFA domain-containing protein [Micromonospora sp. HM134]QDY07785.1 GSCFA domain-containing protein [Micromonospora sp. HM134]
MNPYGALPARSFWRSAVAEPDMLAIDEVWTPKFDIAQDDPVLTAGSCFARHLGPALRDEGMNWGEAELPPPGLTTAERRARHYGAYSFRTGTVYTAAALRQWLSWALTDDTGPDEVWRDGDRYFDPYRPSVEPDGYESAEATLTARRSTLAAIRRTVAGAGCLIFTLGLTEAWRDVATGTVYPVCPGTVRGTFDAGRHAFHNFTVAEVHRDLTATVASLRAANPRLTVLLTVSPVPLTATATGAHVLAATGYSKSVLRAAAGQLAQEHDHVDYFPSYELITGFPFRGVFFAPNLRTVTPAGVSFVMRHFFAALTRDRNPTGPTGIGATAPDRRADAPDGGDLFCDDAVLDHYRAG